MNIYESSYDLSWASPTLRLAIHSQLFTWTYLFGYKRLVQIACGGRYGIKPETSRDTSGGLVWLDPQKHTSTKHRASRGVYTAEGCRPRVSQSWTCQVLLLVLRRTTIVPRKRCQVMSKNSVAVETRSILVRTRRLVLPGVLVREATILLENSGTTYWDNGILYTVYSFGRCW